MSKNLPVWLGWALYLVLMLGYAAVTYRQLANRRAKRAGGAVDAVWLVKSSAWPCCSASAPTT